MTQPGHLTGVAKQLSSQSSETLRGLVADSSPQAQSLPALPLSGAGSLPSQGQRLAVQVALPSPPPSLVGGREGGALGVTDLGQAVYQV